MSAVVVGGGVAGLVAARELALQGREVTLVESTERFGGMVHGVPLAGLLVDAGAEAYATRTPLVRDLCAELGLSVAAPVGRSHVWWPERGALPLAHGFLGIPASLDDDALAALTPAELDRARLDLTEPVGDLGHTLADLVRARLGEAVLERLVAPLTKGVNGLAPDVMPAEQFAPGLAEDTRRLGSLTRAVAERVGSGAPVEQPVGGMHRLVPALLTSLRASGVTTLTESRVAAMRRRSSGWVLDVPGGELEAERVVLAVPARVASRLLRPQGVHFNPPRTVVTRNLLFALSHPGLAAQPVGSGALLGERPPGMVARSLTHYSAKWPWARRDGVEIMRVALPPDREPELQQVLADASLILGVELGADDVVDSYEATWTEMPRVLPAAERASLQEALARFPGLTIAGAWVAGNGLAAVVQSAKDATA
ncbi:FAD-dependent oxidoreductase [Tessaracoccus sp. OS52]|uniref:protoporphyrinogen/coproporphyrinogen oxidase n=1 Tax=Tessaracoccus sp. OS52 TaxID=2886691 RepID=UPI001D0F83CC|nr:FAD-dependent oxidoreductase [Tessaracoccus sp. OS52]